MLCPGLPGTLGFLTPVLPEARPSLTDSLKFQLLPRFLSPFPDFPQHLMV